MSVCQFVPDKPCQFPHKCQSIGCAEKGYAERHYRTVRLPWQTGYAEQGSQVTISNEGAVRAAARQAVMNEVLRHQADALEVIKQLSDRDANGKPKSLARRTAEGEGRG